LLADKSMLIVADNARDSAHVRPLPPGAPRCLVLATSRNQLTGLVATHGAHLIDLDVFSAAEARHLLAWRLGPDRVAAEPGAVREIITRCSRLPVALALVIFHDLLRDYAGQLADTGDSDPQRPTRKPGVWPGPQWTISKGPGIAKTSRTPTRSPCMPPSMARTDRDRRSRIATWLERMCAYANTTRQLST
jgi:hypothetical protein